MKDWNVIITIYQDGYKRALRALREFGAATGSPYHNVLVMRVADPLALLESLERRTTEIPALDDAISRVAPAMANFDFESADEFRRKAKEMTLEWAPRLAGRSFHLRFHRRGADCDLPTPEVERFLDDALLEGLRQAGTPGAICFSDPDAVIAIDTVDNRAGLGLWSLEDLARHHLLRPD
ncbi:THUMP domain-containing protein [Methylocystis sp. IM3]|uniref:THUMP domain-containing protein n=1 Tax=unclassified Methylocystis TaxID=2625913 RepID=UPI0030F845BE